MAKQQISGASGDVVDTLFEIIDGIVEASGKPFIKLAWNVLKPFLKPKQISAQLHSKLGA